MTRPFATLTSYMAELPSFLYFPSSLHGSSAKESGSLVHAEITCCMAGNKSESMYGYAVLIGIPKIAQCILRLWFPAVLGTLVLFWINVLLLEDRNGNRQTEVRL